MDIIKVKDYDNKVVRINTEKITQYYRDNADEYTIIELEYGDDVWTEMPVTAIDRMLGVGK